MDAATAKCLVRHQTIQLWSRKYLLYSCRTIWKRMVEFVWKPFPSSWLWIVFGYICHCLISSQCAHHEFSFTVANGQSFSNPCPMQFEWVEICEPVLYFRIIQSACSLNEICSAASPGATVLPALGILHAYNRLSCFNSVTPLMQFHSVPNNRPSQGGPK